MAVVFISPKGRQRKFFLVITAIFLLFLAAVSFGVFLSKPKEVLPLMVFNKPKVNINMKIFDSDQFKNLLPFAEMETQYSYKAVDKNNKPVTGFVSAASLDKARAILENMDLTVSELKEAGVGRENPFTPYYQTVVEPTPTPSPKAK
jgi:hypothetical protein